MNKSILKFHHPIFLNGLNMTIRRGTKWDGRLGLIWAETDKGEYIGPAQIRFTQVMKFDEISSHLHKFNHDPDCRTKAGVLNELCGLYEAFDVKEIVTLVWFRMGTDNEEEY